MWTLVAAIYHCHSRSNQIMKIKRVCQIYQIHYQHAVYSYCKIDELIDWFYLTKGKTSLI